MNLNRLKAPALALLLGVAGLATVKALPVSAIGQERAGWDAPPAEWNEIQRRGFHDGLEGAHRDFDNHRRPDVDNREEYKHPDDVRGELREAYREGYRSGYERGVAHFWGAPAGFRRDPDAEEREHEAQMRGPEPGGWDVPPGELNEAQRRGFHDGIEAARKDFDNHRRPDVENRDEYRNPKIQGEPREEYREGFRRGYALGVSHLMGVPGGQFSERERGPWDAPPPELSEAARRGFRDGIEGARKDFDNHRRPDFNNREEYREPHVERALREEYREGFRHGYEVAMAHLTGDPDRR
jgi:hypothetical protein